MFQEQLQLASHVPPLGAGRDQRGVGLQPGLGDPGVVLPHQPPAAAQLLQPVLLHASQTRLSPLCPPRRVQTL